VLSSVGHANGGGTVGGAKLRRAVPVPSDTTELNLVPSVRGVKPQQDPARISFSSGAPSVYAKRLRRSDGPSRGSVIHATECSTRSVLSGGGHRGVMARPTRNPRPAMSNGITSTTCRVAGHPMSFPARTRPN
jgi:hypothetical protein